MAENLKKTCLNRITPSEIFNMTEPKRKRLLRGMGPSLNRILNETAKLGGFEDEWIEKADNQVQFGVDN